MYETICSGTEHGSVTVDRSGDDAPLLSLPHHHCLSFLGNSLVTSAPRGEVLPLITGSNAAFMTLKWYSMGQEHVWAGWCRFASIPVSCMLGRRE